MIHPISRRSMLATTGIGTLSTLFPAALSQQPDKSRPERPPQAQASRNQPPNPSIGQPVSQTAAAQEGKPVVPAPPPPKVRFALVGLGKLMIDEILPAIDQTSGCQITALVTGSPGKGRAVADHLGLDHSRVFSYQQIESFRDDDTIDAVYIATPNSIHKRDAVAAFKAGKHVLCEKPLATTQDDAQAMIDAARNADRQLMTAYRVHHEPINRQMRDWLRERRYGKPHFIVFDTVMDVGRKPQPRLSRQLNGGGSLLDIGIYALNTSCWLLGEEPVEVAASQWNDPEDDRFSEVEGSIAFQLRFPSGCVANCTSSFGTTPVNRYRIICGKGWMGMEPATNYRGLRGEHGDKDQHIVLKQPESVNQFAAEFDHFAQCVRGLCVKPLPDGVGAGCEVH